MASGIYNVFKSGALRAQYVLGVHTINVCLLNTVHSFSAQAHTVYGNVSGNELAAAGGYVLGGQMLTSVAFVTTTASTFDAADLSWTSSTFVAGHAVIYDKSTGNALIASIDFGANKEVSAGTFTLQWNGTGIITLA